MFLAVVKNSKSVQEKRKKKNEEKEQLLKLQ